VLRACRLPQHWSEAALRETLGFDADVAAKLRRLCRGLDDTPVAERPPPKTLSVQVVFRNSAGGRLAWPSCRY